MRVIKEGASAYTCGRCACEFMPDDNDIHSKMGGTHRHPTTMQYWVECPWCGLLVDVKKRERYSDSRSKEDVNPYPRNSYNSGLRREDGEPYYGTDVKWLLWEIKHGRLPNSSDPR